jgi:hypothetical protein
LLTANVQRGIAGICGVLGEEECAGSTTCYVKHPGKLPPVGDIVESDVAVKHHVIHGAILVDVEAYLMAHGHEMLLALPRVDGEYPKEL